MLNVSRAGHYDWSDQPPFHRSLADVQLTARIAAIHASVYEAFLAHATDAVRVLQEPDAQRDVEPSIHDYAWVRISGHTFRRELDVPRLSWGLSIARRRDVLHGLPSYEQLQRELHADPRIARGRRAEATRRRRSRLSGTGETVRLLDLTTRTLPAEYGNVAPVAACATAETARGGRTGDRHPRRFSTH